MTERREEALGTGPGGLVLPKDLAPEEEPFGGETVERKLDRIEALLRASGNEGLERIERLLTRSCDAVETRLQGLSLDLAGMDGVQADLARKFDVEEVLEHQKREFGYMRECLAWARGAASAWSPAPRPDPAPRSRAGVAMLSLLWALTVAAAFGAGAIAFGGLRVDVAWEQGSARQAAAAPSSLFGDSADERRRERAAAERAAWAMESLLMEAGRRGRDPVEGIGEGLVAPPALEAVPPGEGLRGVVVPPEGHIDFVEPADAILAPAATGPAGEAGRPEIGPALPPRRGSPVAEPGTP